jgi:hypothetical protein
MCLNAHNVLKQSEKIIVIKLSNTFSPQIGQIKYVQENLFNF